MLSRLHLCVAAALYHLMLASIVHFPGITYPTAEEFFSPSEAYPEYRLSHLATKPNPVYKMVRDAFAQAGLDKENFGTADWNPLGRYISPGQKVFVLSNFVHHRSRTETRENFLGKCTHGSVIRAVIDYVLIALAFRPSTRACGSAGPSDGGQESPLPRGTTAVNTTKTEGRIVPSDLFALEVKGSVRFGNAALQSCDFERALLETGASAVRDFYHLCGLPVEAKDLRRLVTEHGITGRTRRTIFKGKQNDVVEVVLDRESLLTELDINCPGQTRYRVVDYSPEITTTYHGKGRHAYLIHRDILDSDVIVSVPKLKTHEKVGITCGLKGFVGMVARKDCLPHHRLGCGASGGDEYPKGIPLLRLHSWLGDFANSIMPHSSWAIGPGEGASRASHSFFLTQIAYHTLGRILRRLGLVTSGGWSGNDTCWRMALDLARVAHLSDAAGQMGKAPCRKNIMVLDGIVGGEDDGPLAPTAVPSCCLVFSDDIVLGDRLACRLMGYDPASFRLLVEARSALPAEGDGRGAINEATVMVKEGRVAESIITSIIGRAFRPPRGWLLHLTRNQRHV